MKCLLILCVFLSVTLAKRTKSPQNSKIHYDEDILPPHRQIQYPPILARNKLSPYAEALYELATVSNVFDRLYDASFQSSQAADAFFKAIRYFARSLGVMSDNVHAKVAHAAYGAFKSDINPLNYFKMYSNAIEEYLIREKLLTSKNVQSVAKSHLKSLENSLKSAGPLSNPEARLNALVTANVNFLQSFKNMSDINVVRMMLIFTEEMNHLTD